MSTRGGKTPLKSLLRDKLIQFAIARRSDLRSLENMRNAPNLVRVINLHGVLRADAASFDRQMRWASTHCQPISYDTFHRAHDDPSILEACDRPPVLVTFDDGLANQADVAGPILDRYGIQAVFFVVPDFMACEADDARRYYLQYIDHAEAADAPPEVWQPMSRQQACDLVDAGHTIGNHSKTHRPMHLVPRDELWDEIVTSGDMLRQSLGIDISCFAWPHHWDRINAAAWQHMCEHYDVCFTPCPGTHDVNSSRHMVFRTNTEADYPDHTVRYMYSGLSDRWWRRQRAWLRNLYESLPTHQTSMSAR